MEPHATKGRSQSQIDGLVFLHPRPRTHPRVAIALLPLLPKPTCVPLPAELWSRILRLTMTPEPDIRTAWEGQAARMQLILVCRMFKNLVSPMLYAEPHLPTLDAFIRFTARLLEADAKWDNLRRIPYSTPGRWVHTLNLNLIRHLNSAESFEFDKSLNRLFSVLPFLASLILHGSVSLSRRTMGTLADSEAVIRLQSLTSIQIPSVTYGSQPRFARASFEDPLTNLIRSCINLEHLELVGNGWDTDSETEDVEDDSSYPEPSAISLPQLSSLSIINVANCPLLVTLAYSPLPLLQALTISLYVPSSDEGRKPDSTIFFERHGDKLKSLTLAPAQTWPPTGTHAPPSILLDAPNLRYLSLPSPSSNLLIPPISKSSSYYNNSTTILSSSSPSRPNGFLTSPNTISPPTSPPTSPPLVSPSQSVGTAIAQSGSRNDRPGYPLRILSIPRPTPDLLSRIVEPVFTNLREVHVREVRYLKRGMGKGAASTGSSAVIMEWRRFLARRGVRVLDALGHDGPR